MALSIASAMAISAIALKVLPLPFVWVFLAWALCGIAFSLFGPAAGRWLFLFGVSAMSALSLAELFFSYTAIPEIQRTWPRYEPDPVLGWKPRPSQVVRASAMLGDETIYRVTYSIDRLGHRVGPPVREGHIEGCVLFFADSFVFGEGVEDHEAMPYQFGVKTGGRFRVINLAVSGYGAEHMLAIVERGELATSKLCTPTHIVYVALPHHVHRAAGKQWSIRGPRYRLLADGTPAYVGTNPAGEPKASDAIMQALDIRFREQLAKSQIYRAWTSRPVPSTESEIDFYFSILRHAFRLFEQRWPQAERHVISWEIHDFYAGGRERFRRGVHTVPATVHYIDDILPGYTSDPVRYGLHRYDLHPNAMAHETVAAYLASRIAPTAP